MQQIRAGPTGFPSAYDQDEGWTAERAVREVAVDSISGWTTTSSRRRVLPGVPLPQAPRRALARRGVRGRRRPLAGADQAADLAAAQRPGPAARAGAPSGQPRRGHHGQQRGHDVHRRRARRACDGDRAAGALRRRDHRGAAVGRHGLAAGRRRPRRPGHRPGRGRQRGARRRRLPHLAGRHPIRTLHRADEPAALGPHVRRLGSVRVRYVWPARARPPCWRGCGTSHPTAPPCSSPAVPTASTPRPTIPWPGPGRCRSSATSGTSRPGTGCVWISPRSTTPRSARARRAARSRSATWGRGFRAAGGDPDARRRLSTGR